MADSRTRPSLCECPAFVCPCPAHIYNRAVGQWYCAYCTSRNYTALNRCCVCALPGRCVEKDSGDWYCDEHGHQCDVLVPLPEGCGWLARNLPCSQISRMFDSNGRYICHDHLEELVSDGGTLRFRSAGLRISADDIPDNASLGSLDFDGEVIDLDGISTVIEGECPICLEPKVTWRRLKACGHELCAGCLRELICSSLENRFLCPFDRRPLFDLSPD